MRWGGEVALGVFALLSFVLSRRAGKGAGPMNLPGWSQVEPDERPKARRFLKNYFVMLSLLLLVQAAVIGRLPWRIAAGLVAFSALLLFASAGWGVRRYSRNSPLRR